jgi:hypothetical protein
MEIAESKSVHVKDKLVAMEFLRQLYEDEYSLFLYGPSQFLTKDIGANCGAGCSGGIADTLGLLSPRKTNHEKAVKDNSNAVF